MAEAAGPSTSNPLPELVPFPYLWHDVAEAALRNRFNLHLQEEFIHPDIHPRYITPDESRDRRFEQLLRTIAGIRQRSKLIKHIIYDFYYIMAFPSYSAARSTLADYNSRSR